MGVGGRIPRSMRKEELCAYPCTAITRIILHSDGQRCLLVVLPFRELRRVGKGAYSSVKARSPSYCECDSDHNKVSKHGA